MGTQPFQFDAEAAKRLQRIYVTAYAQHRRAAAREALAVRAGEQVLDIGTGPGFEPYELAAVLGPTGHLHAVDTSETMLQLSRQRCVDQPWVEFQLADAKLLPFAEATFDAAVVVQVYEYVSEVSAALADLYRVLRPGGRAVVIDTDWRSIAWETRDAARMTQILNAFEEHLVHPSLGRSLPLLLKQAGFALKHAQILTAFDLALTEDRFSYGLAQLIVDFVPGRQGLSNDDVGAWYEDLRRIDQEGRYFFCLNQALYLAAKPTEGLMQFEHSGSDLDRMLDLSFVRELVAPFYAAGGRPSIDPVVFFRWQLIMFFEGIRSERQLMETIHPHLAHRWYIGYDLAESVPDHSSLTKIRDRYGLATFQRFFEHVVDLCVQAGLVWGRELHFDGTWLSGLRTSTYARTTVFQVSRTDPDAAPMRHY